MIAPAILAASVSCSDEPRSAAEGHVSAAHGDHRPHHGGTVFMNGDLHFEIVLSRSGTHRLYFSDAMRAALPAATASDVTLTFSNADVPGETLEAEVDESGESWIAKGPPLKGAEVVARLAFVVGNEPYWIDVPYIEAAGRE